MKRFSIINDWFTRLVFHKNDTPELILRKKFFLVTNLIAIFFLLCITVLAYLLELENLAEHILMLLTFTVAQTILLIIIKQWSKWFIYTVFSAYIILIFYIIISLGGLPIQPDF